MTTTTPALPAASPSPPSRSPARRPPPAGGAVCGQHNPPPPAGALGGGCDLQNVYPPAEGVGYTPDGTLVVYTVSGMKLYDARLGAERNSILLDPTPGGGTVDVPIGFD